MLTYHLRIERVPTRIPAMDIHQPLHAANDADRGGNCVMVDSHPQDKDLHAAWDATIVRRLEHSIDSGRPDTTARRLEQTYAAERETDSWIPTDDIAWESNQVARSRKQAAAPGGPIAQNDGRAVERLGNVQTDVRSPGGNL
jgi:hypothetical protein